MKVTEAGEWNLGLVLVDSLISQMKKSDVFKDKEQRLDGRNH